ncbi:serine/threonine-protein kinase [Ideonella livida]|uniref:Protein kinase n=1 Tax=Ideonella livida TaxID=2707176 RepID=A0A7C9PJ39_9BURK|nr:serine/threonine-protein kinase [Ideonella livida]NDY92412.1 protein kinase [Ideonella livida]
MRPSRDALKAALYDLSEMTAPARSQWLDRCARDMPTLHEALLPYLPGLNGPTLGASQTAVHQAAIASASQAGATGAETLTPGTRLGAWALDEPLGRGGMGVVWAAHRADGHFERQVALKLLPPLWADPTLRARFDRETQVLARLSHPHIAALLDAGRTEDGTAWLVMERVDGLPLTEHARRHALGLRARVALMSQLAEAVAHAHRHLLVHRDLKPANVLVDAQGQVRLLDFGVARLLDEAAGAEPLTREGNPFTPGYASPEQIRGEAVSTLGDVFSLGVMLHELLTGQSPFRGPSDTVGTVMQRTVHEEAQPPSRQPGALPGIDADLDAITLRALAKQPQDRLPGADALAADLRAWLSGHPVAARLPSPLERAGKWVRRHRLLSATALLGVAGTLGFAFTSARNAQQADGHRAVAEQRLQQVRAFARQVIHDYNRELEKLPGTVKVREQLVGDALRYLDAEASGPAPSPAFQRELAQAYLAIGGVQGRGIAGPGLGQFEAAGRSFAQAARLLQPLCGMPDTPPQNAGERAQACLNLAQAEEGQAQASALQGRHDLALPLLRSALARVEGLAPAAGHQPDPSSTPAAAAKAERETLRLSLLSTLASLESLGDGAAWQQALPRARAYQAAVKQAAQDTTAPAAIGPGPWDIQAGLAADLLAFLQGAHGEDEQALSLIAPVVERARPWARPEEALEARILLATSAQTEGELRLQAGQVGPGLARLRESTALATQLLRADPDNSQAQHGQLMSVWRLVRGLRRSGQPAEAVSLAGAVRPATSGAEPPVLQGQRLRLATEQALALVALGRPQQALPLASHAFDGLNALLGPAAADPAQGPSPRRQHLGLALAAQAWVQAAAPEARLASEAARRWTLADAQLGRWLEQAPDDLETQAQRWQLCQLALDSTAPWAQDPSLRERARAGRDAAASALRRRWADGRPPPIWRQG